MRALLLLGLLIAAPAAARDVGQWSDVDPAIRQWFEHLRARDGILCCADNDGLDVDWDLRGARYYVKIDGEWVVVPENAIVIVPNLLGVAKVWLAADRSIRCFLPGNLT